MTTDNLVLMGLAAGAILSLTTLFGAFADVADDMIGGGIVRYEPASFSAKFIDAEGNEVKR